MEKHQVSEATTLYFQSKAELLRKERNKTTFGCLAVVMLCVGIMVVLFWSVQSWIHYSFNFNPAPAFSQAALMTPEAGRAQDPVNVSMMDDEPGGAGGTDHVRAGSMSRIDSTIQATSESYRIIGQTEVPDRLVAGRMESVTYTVAVQPKSAFLPESAQLKQIATKLHSDLHNTTYVYFYLPGMNRNGMPWATAHFLDSSPFEVRINNSAIPSDYKHLGDPSKEEWEL